MVNIAMTDEIEAWLNEVEQHVKSNEPLSTDYYLGNDEYSIYACKQLLSLVRVYREENEKLKYALVQYAAGKDLRSVGNFNDYCDANKRYAQKVLLEARTTEEKAKEIING